MFINSINNLDISNGEPKCGGNLYLASNDNTYFWSDRDGQGPKNGKNVFINSYRNYSNSEHNTFINASDCITNIDNEASVLIGSEGLTYQNSVYNYDIGSYVSTINDSWQTLLLRTDSCYISAANYSTIIACQDCYIKPDPYIKGTSDAANPYDKMMLNGYGLKGMNDNRQIIMGKLNSTYHNYTRLTEYHPDEKKWRLEAINGEGGDPNEYTEQVSSYFVIGAGRHDTRRRNALEFDLVDDITAYGSFWDSEYNKEYDGSIGRLTTD
jgi:hypothetical protein